MLARIVVWWSAMTMLTGAASGLWSMLAVRFLFGMGEAGLLPTLARAFRAWLPPWEAGWAFGLPVMTGAVPGASTQAFAAGLIAAVGWRSSFVVFGAVGLVWVVVWLRSFSEELHQPP